MGSVEKLFKAIRDSPGKGAKRYIAHEIVGQYCGVQGLLGALLTEAFFLSESASWEDRLAASLVVEEMARLGTIPSGFFEEEQQFEFDLEKVMRGRKYLASYYTDTPEDAEAGGSKEKEFLDLEDPNVVLRLSNIKLPGGAKKRQKEKEKKQKEPAQVEEKREVDSAETLCALLVENLGSYVWERRHGASQMVLGLLRGMKRREAAVLTVKTVSKHSFLRALLTTLVMDRFNDYEMDAAVSPVRECVARALKEMLSFISSKEVQKIVRILVGLGKFDDWQLRYSGMVGIKHVVSELDPKRAGEIFRNIADVCVSLLNDIDEEVKGVAAQILASMIDRICAGESGRGNEAGRGDETRRDGEAGGLGKTENAHSGSETERRERIEAFMNIEELVDLCWESLEEEEELAIAKAKIMNLMEKIQKSGFNLGDIDKRRYKSVLLLLRSPIDTVRASVLSLLREMQPVLITDAVSSLLFSLMMEEEESVQNATAEVLKKIVREAYPKTNEQGAAKREKIVRAFLHVSCMPYYIGSSLQGLGSLVVIGETDVCVTDEGCKSAGEERVLRGRAKVFETICDIESFSPYVQRFFRRSGSSASLPYFILFKGAASLYMSSHAVQESKDHAVALRKELLENEGSAEENANELNRGGYNLARVADGVGKEEDYASLMFLFGTSTPRAILRAVSRCVKLHVEAFEPLLKIASECVIEIGRAAEDVREEREDAAVEETVKRQKLSLENAEGEEETPKVLVLFEELGDLFVKTDTFEKLERRKSECVEFLRSTVGFFQNFEKLVGVFEQSVEDKAAEVVSYFIARSRSLNEKFILSAIERVERTRETPDEDHAGLFSFLGKVLPFSSPELLVVLAFPLVDAMNTAFSVPGTREKASQAFSAVVPSMYLRGKLECESADLENAIIRSRERVNGLQTHEKMEKISMNVSLREYQKKGIEWMRFLKKCGLSGMLCDDMGLGKTVQVLAFLAGEQEAARRGGASGGNEEISREAVEHGIDTEKEAKERKNVRMMDARTPDMLKTRGHRTGKEEGAENVAEAPEKEEPRGGARSENGTDLRDETGSGETSAQASPRKSSVLFHFSVLVLCPSALTGHWHAEVATNFPTLTTCSIKEFKGEGICVSSYDKFRTNVAQFQAFSWSHLVLDEGHIIKNASTLLHSRVKSLSTQHRILLSGTPIQNSVSELWALFDLLMPGYLGTEKEFAKKYLRPILKGRDGKGTTREAEAAKEKLEELHRVVLPFMLRRMKEAVLADLPPKVIKDVYVSMEGVQKKIYETLREEGDTPREYGEVSSSSKSFHYLSLLIKTASHPAGLSLADLARVSVTAKEAKEATSGKISALLDLLRIMVQTSKILVFCQYKSTVDIVSKCVGDAFPEMRWCRLDGTVKGEERAALAKRFNSDPELAVMYLTTHAGGLGLNLTGADVVIFFEHDWNPMMDLQAMDRAHRLGQKKSVSVFRLITKDTIEESIMSLQRFKKYVAGTVVNQQNVEIETMDTANVLERMANGKTPETKRPAKEEEYEDLI